MTGPALGVVLIVAPGDDLHALAVQRQIERRGLARVVILDPATFPIASRVTWTFTPGLSLDLDLAAPLASNLSPRVAHVLTDRPVTLRVSRRDVLGVWLRRWRSPIPHPAASEAGFAAYCVKNIHDDLTAALSVLPTHNPFWAEERLASKRYQLWLAQTSGLPIPQTLITSDPRAARDFIIDAEQRGAEVVCKQASDETEFSVPTRKVGADDLDRLDALRYAPATFQHRVRGGSNLRVAVLGGQVFACLWNATSPDPVDIRLDPGARMQGTSFPEAYLVALHRFHAASGLTFGVYDFKLDEQGTPYFLEVNVSGQWLDLELDGGHPISSHWASVLSGTPVDAPSPLSHAEADALRPPEAPITSLTWTPVL